MLSLIIFDFWFKGKNMWIFLSLEHLNTIVEVLNWTNCNILVSEAIESTKGKEKGRWMEKIRTHTTFFKFTILSWWVHGTPKQLLWLHQRSTNTSHYSIREHNKRLKYVKHYKHVTNMMWRHPVGKIVLIDLLSARRRNFNMYKM